LTDGRDQLWHGDRPHLRDALVSNFRHGLPVRSPAVEVYAMMSPGSLRRRTANLLWSSLVPLVTVGVVLLVLVAAGVIPSLPAGPVAIEEAQADPSADAPSLLIGEDRPRPTFVVLIVRSTISTAERRVRLSNNEIALLESLVESGALITVPQIGIRADEEGFVQSRRRLNSRHGA
jgi:hypothetical protein